MAADLWTSPTSATDPLFRPMADGLADLDRT